MAAVLATIAIPATAADLLPRRPVPLVAQPLPPPPVGMTWSGFYIGGNLGAAFNPNDLSIKDLSEEQDHSLRFSNDTDLIGGVHAGYNWQTGSWVLGIEGDADFAGCSMALAGWLSSTVITISWWFPLTMGRLVSAAATTTPASWSEVG